MLGWDGLGWSEAVKNAWNNLNCLWKSEEQFKGNSGKKISSVWNSCRNWRRNEAEGIEVLDNKATKPIVAEIPQRIDELKTGGLKDAEINTRPNFRRYGDKVISDKNFR